MPTKRQTGETTADRWPKIVIDDKTRPIDFASRSDPCVESSSARSSATRVLLLIDDGTRPRLGLGRRSLVEGKSEIDASEKTFERAAAVIITACSPEDDQPATAIATSSKTFSSDNAPN